MLLWVMVCLAHKINDRLRDSGVLQAPATGGASVPTLNEIAAAGFTYRETVSNISEASTYIGYLTVATPAVPVAVTTPAPVAVPTMSQWALLLLGSVVVLLGLNTRRKAALQRN